MGRHRKAYLAVLSGRADANISWEEMVSLLEYLGFSVRMHGSHHVFVRDGIDELLNLQRSGAQVKRYQVRQVMDILVRNGLEVQP